MCQQDWVPDQQTLNENAELQNLFFPAHMQYESCQTSDAIPENELGQWLSSGEDQSASGLAGPSTQQRAPTSEDWLPMERTDSVPLEGLDSLGFVDMQYQSLPPSDEHFPSESSLSQQRVFGLPLGNLQSCWDNAFDFDLGLFNNIDTGALKSSLGPGRNTYDFLPGNSEDDALSDATTVVPNASDSAVHATSDSIPLNSLTPFATDDERWQATLSRSRAADRFFLYGVQTTKVFCRPSCASRRASRKHITFFPFPSAIEDAKRAGFRPCKRCAPETLAVADKGVNGVVKALRMIISDAFEANACRGKPLKLEDLAKAACLSPFHFQRVFKATTQITPGEFATACQSLALQDALARQNTSEGQLTSNWGMVDKMDVNDILKNYSRWSFRTAKKALGGVAPTDYAVGAPKLEVLYACTECPAGPLCIAYSGVNAIHAVLLGQTSELRIQSRFFLPTRSNEHVKCINQRIQMIHDETKDRDSELPQDLLPSLWRARVWLRLVRENVV